MITDSISGSASPRTFDAQSDLNLNGATVLITGGSGLIGRQLVHHLRTVYPTVHIVIFDPEPPEEDGCEFVRGSVLDDAAVGRACRGADCIVHLAAALGVEATETDKLWCLDVNIRGTLAVLEAAAKERVAKVVFASSSEVYGDTPQLPITEDAPLNPKSVYGAAKLAGEEYTRAYSQRYGFAHAIVRFFNVYGPMQASKFVVPRFVRAMLDGQRPEIYGDGEQVRAYCHVNDAVEGLRLLLTCTAANDQIINIGNPAEPITVRELYDRVAVLCGSKIRPRFEDLIVGGRSVAREIFRRYPSIDKARRLLGYEPAIDLDAGIQTVIDAWRDRAAIDDTSIPPVAGQIEVGVKSTAQTRTRTKAAV